MLQCVYPAGKNSSRAWVLLKTCYDTILLLMLFKQPSNKLNKHHNSMVISLHNLWQCFKGCQTFHMNVLPYGMRFGEMRFITFISSVFRIEPKCTQKPCVGIHSSITLNHLYTITYHHNGHRFYSLASIIHNSCLCLFLYQHICIRQTIWFFTSLKSGSRSHALTATRKKIQTKLFIYYC